MVVATCVQVSGIFKNSLFPQNRPMSLNGYEPRLKQPGLQFQGKIQDKDNWITIFAESGSDDDDNANQHVLGGNFSDEIFIGSMVVMLSWQALNAIAHYDKPASAYRTD